MNHDAARARCFVVWLSAAVAACGSGHQDNGTPGDNAGKAAASAGGPSGSGGAAAGAPSSTSGGTGGTTGGAGGTTGGTGGARAGAGGSGKAGGGQNGGGRSNAGTGGSAGSAGDAGEAAGGGPAPATSWVNATGNLAGIQSECGNLTLVSATPDSGTVIAGVARLGLFATDDSGTQWDPLGTGAGSAVITNRPSAIVYDPKDATTFWESGIYNGGGVYKTTDSGQTLEQLGEVTHNDLVSVDFSDPDRKTLLVGGHEQKQTLYLSTDGGGSFTQIGENLPSDSHFSSQPLVIDSQTFLVGACGYGDGVCGVYRSENAGQDWTLASPLSVAARPLWASDDSIYWAIINDGGLARSTDHGMTWNKTSDNIVTWYPVELPDGRILTVGGDHVVVSADHGSSWIQVGDTLPFKASGVTYSVVKKTLFVWHWDCGTVVLPDAIASAGFDYTKN